MEHASPGLRIIASTNSSSPAASQKTGCCPQLRVFSRASRNSARGQPPRRLRARTAAGSGEDGRGGEVAAGAGRAQPRDPHRALGAAPASPTRAGGGRSGGGQPRPPPPGGRGGGLVCGGLRRCRRLPAAPARLGSAGLRRGSRGRAGEAGEQRGGPQCASAARRRCGAGAGAPGRREPLPRCRCPRSPGARRPRAFSAACRRPAAGLRPPASARRWRRGPGRRRRGQCGTAARMAGGGSRGGKLSASGWETSP